MAIELAVTRTGREGIEIKLARILSGKTQAELAMEVGIHPVTLSQIETGRVVASDAELLKLRRATNWTSLVSFFVQAFGKADMAFGIPVSTTTHNPQIAPQGGQGPEEGDKAGRRDEETAEVA